MGSLEAGVGPPAATDRVDTAPMSTLVRRRRPLGSAGTLLLMAGLDAYTAPMLTGYFLADAVLVVSALLTPRVSH